MKEQGNRVVSPVWAQRIDVKVEEDSLWVTGWGHIYGPLSTGEIDRKNLSNLDFFRRLRLRQSEVRRPALKREVGSISMPTRRTMRS